MTKEIEEKVATFWNGTDPQIRCSLFYSIELVNYICSQSLLTQSADVQERAMEYAKKESDSVGGLSPERIDAIAGHYLAGASSLQAENERFREALEKIGNLKRHELDLGESWYNRLTDATSTAKQALNKQ